MAKTPKNFLPLVGVICAPIFTWAYWVSSSIVVLKEENAFARGEKHSRQDLSLSPVFQAKVSELADMTLPIESLLKKIGILKGETNGPSSHK